MQVSSPVTSKNSRSAFWSEDQTGERVLVPGRAKRIVSLVPSQTELLFDLGVGERVAGLTRYCLHPREAREITTVVGGTKRLNREKLDALKPDLIIGNKEENERAMIESLREHYPVWLSDIENYVEALQMIRMVGELVGEDAAAHRLEQSIESAWSAINVRNDACRVLYMIWQKPFMAAASNTFIDDVLTRLGFENCLASSTRYPQLTETELDALNPDCIMLSSEPFPFAEEHVRSFESRFPRAKVLKVDGEMFSWYGSRLLKAPAYFSSLADAVGGDA